ncbi:MAG: hypothetical protein KTR33_03765, partial [Gammaproteobacteria bacterium]|nr:hypothetical protein [Gammaproteobacteria bacterium]
IRSSAYQIIVRVDHTDAAMLSNHEIVHRWCRLYRVPAPVRRYLKGVDALETDAIEINACCQSWRQHMTDVGKYVGHLNQTLSRRANLEDACSGRFWEPRTRLRPLGNAAALTAALAVVRGEQIGARSRTAVKPTGSQPLPVIKVA